LIHEKVFISVPREHAGLLREWILDMIATSAVEDDQIDDIIDIYVDLRNSIKYYDDEHEKASKPAEIGGDS
jgi:hypothetical protein